MYVLDPQDYMLIIMHPQISCLFTSILILRVILCLGMYVPSQVSVILAMYVFSPHTQLNQGVGLALYENKTNQLMRCNRVSKNREGKINCHIARFGFKTPKHDV